MSKRISVLFVAGLLLLAACAAPASNSGAPAPANTEPAAAPTGASAAAATVPAAASATANSAPATVPTTAPAAATASAAAAAESSAAGAAAPAGVMHLVIDPSASEARFQAREVLAGHTLQNDAIGRTKAVSGDIVIQPDGTLVPGQSKITVDLTGLTSDSAMRDGFIKRATLDTAHYPTVTFAPTAVQGLPSPLPSSGDVNFTITGDITVKGKPYPTTWQATGKIDGNQMTGSASTSFKFEDFGLTMPKVNRVLSIEDNVKLVLDYTVVKQ